MEGRLTTRHARNLFNQIRERSEFWEPTSEDEKCHAMVSTGSQTDIAAGGLLEILKASGSEHNKPCTELPFMDEFVLVILATMMAQQIDQGITTVSNAYDAGISALESASGAVQGEYNIFK